jgi:hypothetical protein
MRRRRTTPRPPQGDDRVWRWQKRICAMLGCYTEIGAKDFFCEHHRARPPAKSDGVLKPIPLARLMGRRA